MHLWNECVHRPVILCYVSIQGHFWIDHPKTMLKSKCDSWYHVVLVAASLGSLPRVSWNLAHKFSINIWWEMKNYLPNLAMTNAFLYSISIYFTLLASICKYNFIFVQIHQSSAIFMLMKALYLAETCLLGDVFPPPDLENYVFRIMVVSFCYTE